MQHDLLNRNSRVMLPLVNSPAHKMPRGSTDQTVASLNLPPLQLSDRTGECRSKDPIISETINQRVSSDGTHINNREFLLLKIISNGPIESRMLSLMSGFWKHTLKSLCFSKTAMMGLLTSAMSSYLSDFQRNSTHMYSCSTRICCSSSNQSKIFYDCHYSLSLKLNFKTAALSIFFMVGSLCSLFLLLTFTFSQQEMVMSSGLCPFPHSHPLVNSLILPI